VAVLAGIIVIGLVGALFYAITQWEPTRLSGGP
jgi:hypothetical protein